MSSFIIYTPQEILLELSNHGKWDEQIWGRREMRMGFWWGNMKEIDYLEDLSVNMKIILKKVFKK